MRMCAKAQATLMPADLDYVVADGAVQCRVHHVFHAVAVVRPARKRQRAGLAVDKMPAREEQHRPWITPAIHTWQGLVLRAQRLLG